MFFLYVLQNTAKKLVALSKYFGHISEIYRFESTLFKFAMENLQMFTLSSSSTDLDHLNC